ncbi:hypothetical protein RN001_008556 [Aquatica leii]|uniref:Uncharacterized protein n=1 Tax=Aquatica leii TaxID=1421715 RepID=A0AAN7SRE2_9COLE|nr:hypothetical protein RN001_008556 [Aquatica leii]
MDLVPKCDPFKEELCLVSEAHNTETIALLCVRQVLTGGTMKQFMPVCPINCRETGKQNQLITPIGSHKFLVTHPKENLTLQCPEKHHNLTINPNIGSLWVDIPCYCYFKDNSLKNIYPTYPCVDKTITYSTRQVIPAVWSKFPGLTLPSWETTMPQFDNLNSCLNEAWIENHQDEVSTPKITYFVIMNFILIIVLLGEKKKKRRKNIRAWRQIFPSSESTRLRWKGYSDTNLSKENHQLSLLSLKCEFDTQRMGSTCIRSVIKCNHSVISVRISEAPLFKL